MVLYVTVAETEKSEAIELPVDSDNTMMLTTLTSQFPGASGLKYRNAETGAMRAISLSDSRFHPPEQGWSKVGTLYCVFPKVENKRRGDDLSDDEMGSKPKRQKCSDLIVLGLPWKTTEAELKEYFSQFGELLMAQVKKNTDNGLSKGFGFVRFADYDVQKKVVSKRHNIGGRWCDVRIPLSRGDAYSVEYNRKIFVGRLTEDISVDDLREYFSKFGEITDVFIPRPFRAFAFVTFESDLDPSVCGDDHIVRGISLHVSNAMPKGDFGVGRYNDQFNSHYSYNQAPAPPMPPTMSSSLKQSHHHSSMVQMNHPASRYSPQQPYYQYASRRSNYGQPVSRRID